MPVQQDTSVSPSCPQCSAKMMKRSGRLGEFWGCSSYPSCRGTRPFAEERRAQKGCPPITGSDQQKAIWDAIEQTQSHLVVEAGAGCGKTTTMVVAGYKLPPGLRVGYCVFNKANAIELSEKIPSDHEAGTVHSLIGLRSIRAAMPKVKINGNKTRDIAEKLVKSTTNVPKKLIHPVAAAVAKLAGLCKGALIERIDLDIVEELSLTYGVDLFDRGEEITDVLAATLAECKKTASTIDFDDMLWLPIVLGMRIVQFDVLFVDECQDINPCQLQLILGSIGTNGRLVAVGDSDQAIYGFRGADVDSIPNIIKALESTPRGATILPLNQTRRCPKSVVAVANQLVPSLQALPEAPEGIVEVVDEEKFFEECQPGDMVLSRVNAPLIGFAYKFLKHNKRAVIKGRDIGAGIMALVKSLKANSLDDLLKKADQHYEQQAAKLAGTKKEYILSSLDDKVECLYALASFVNSIDELQAKCDELFAETDSQGRVKEAIVLSSGHRSKGLECDTVYIVSPEKIPHPMATKPWEQTQERNLAYVMVTRAKRRLVCVGAMPRLLEEKK